MILWRPARRSDKTKRWDKARGNTNMDRKGVLRGCLGAAFFVAVCAAAGPPVQAQELFIYPAQGQNEEDRFECHSWAVQQSGFDPSNPGAQQQAAANVPPPPGQEATKGGVLQGGARGAAVGVVGGAIAGNAGKGAAIGAATGALLGGMRRSDQRRQQEQQQKNYDAQVRAAEAQQQQAAAGGRQSYNRAMTACLEARGYSVS
jgi:hypothetical protein